MPPPPPRPIRHVRAGVVTTPSALARGSEKRPWSQNSCPARLARFGTGNAGSAATPAASAAIGNVKLGATDQEHDGAPSGPRSIGRLVEPHEVAFVPSTPMPAAYASRPE